jgi:uncharacterized protein (TIGR03067 family)
MNANPESQPGRGPSPEALPAPPPISRDDRTAGPVGAPPPGPITLFQGGSLRLFRVAGIDVWLHWSWAFFAFLRLQGGAADSTLDFAHYQSQVWYLVEYVALFVFVLLHELGHVLACRSVGGVASSIVLWPLGGVAYIDPPARPAAWLWSIAAGPLTNALLLAPTLGFWAAGRAAGWEETAPDLYRFAAALAWLNGYLLVFNLLPIYPLDGGKMLHALLWPFLGRARSLLASTAIGLLTAAVLLVLAIAGRSLVWGIMAGLGVLFCLLGLQGARALLRTRDAPRRAGAACPCCGAAPPVGRFWLCTRCWASFDAFAGGGNCPNCGTPLAAALCFECGRERPWPDWHPGAAPVPTLAGAGQAQAPATAARPTVGQRVVWGTIFAAFALVLCGLPNVEEQPLGLIVWTAGGAILGATSAGALTRTWRTGQARRKLRGTWRLVEVDGVAVADGAGQARQLVLTDTAYRERVGDGGEVRGVCWTDPLAEPAAISLTPKAGPDAGNPRQGIYRLDGETLTVCIALPGQPRPTALVARPGVQQVQRYRRETA